VKFGHVASFGVTKASPKVFPIKIVFFYQFTKVFSLESFPLDSTRAVLMDYPPASISCVQYTSWNNWHILDMGSTSLVPTPLSEKSRRVWARD